MSLPTRKACVFKVVTGTTLIARDCRLVQYSKRVDSKQRFGFNYAELGGDTSLLTIVYIFVMRIFVNMLFLLILVVPNNFFFIMNLYYVGHLSHEKKIIGERINDAPNENRKFYLFTAFLSNFHPM